LSSSSPAGSELEEYGEGVGVGAAGDRILMAPVVEFEAFTLRLRIANIRSAADIDGMHGGAMANSDSSELARRGVIGYDE
jgi:hypothetical protein